MNGDGIPAVTLREAFEYLLCHGGVKVALNGHARDVELPDHVRAYPVVLWYELDPAGVPIHDLEATDQGISATLSFSREPHKTFVPWAAVLGIGPLRPEQAARKAERAKLRLV
jgi:hypothetical protein